MSRHGHAAAYTSLRVHALTGVCSAVLTRKGYAQSDPQRRASDKKPRQHWANAGDLVVTSETEG
jgi:hypothetical protein